MRSPTPVPLLQAVPNARDAATRRQRIGYSHCLKQWHEGGTLLRAVVCRWFGEPGLLVCWLGGIALWLLLWAAHVQAERRRPTSMAPQRDGGTVQP